MVMGITLCVTECCPKKDWNPVFMVILQSNIFCSFSSQIILLCRSTASSSLAFVHSSCYDKPFIQWNADKQESNLHILVLPIQLKNFHHSTKVFFVKSSNRPLIRVHIRMYYWLTILWRTTLLVMQLQFLLRHFPISLPRFTSTDTDKKLVAANTFQVHVCVGTSLKRK